MQLKENENGQLLIPVGDYEGNIFSVTKIDATGKEENYKK